MKITKITRVLTSVSGFIIGGIVASKLAIKAYEAGRDTPIQNTVLFDGIMLIPIMILAFIAGGVICVLTLHYIFKKISKET